MPTHKWTYKHIHADRQTDIYMGQYFNLSWSAKTDTRRLINTNGWMDLYASCLCILFFVLFRYVLCFLFCIPVFLHLHHWLARSSTDKNNGQNSWVFPPPAFPVQASAPIRCRGHHQLGVSEWFLNERWCVCVRVRVCVASWPNLIDIQQPPLSRPRFSPSDLPRSHHRQFDNWRDITQMKHSRSAVFHSIEGRFSC